MVSSYSLIRYADDFVVFHPRLEVLEAVKEEIVKFLAPLNLELHPDKTRIVHSMENYNGQKSGFTFLSTHYSHNATRKHGEGMTGSTPKNKDGTKDNKVRRYNWVLKQNPDTKAIAKHLESLRSEI